MILPERLVGERPPLVRLLRWDDDPLPERLAAAGGVEEMGAWHGCRQEHNDSRAAMLLEDECGQVNLIVPKDVYERHRAIVRNEPLLLAHGRYERVGENRNILVSSIETLRALARRVAELDVGASLPRAHHFGHR